MFGVFIRFYQWSGWRGQLADPLMKFLSSLAPAPILIRVMGIVTALILSLAKSCLCPAAFPTSVRFIHGGQASYLPVMLNSGVLALSASFFSVTVMFLWLYHEQFRTLKSRILRLAIYLPRLVLQISFLFSLSWAGIDGTWLALIYIHIIFILPYVWLILAPAFAQMDERHEYVTSSLGLGPFHRLLRVSIPILAMPIGAALFIVFSVSTALYLPTVFDGGERIATITVKAVNLAANGSSGPAGVAAMLQLLIPLTCYVVIWIFLRYRFGKFANIEGDRLI